MVTGEVWKTYEKTVLDGSVSPSIVNWRPSDNTSAWLYSAQQIPSDHQGTVVCNKLRTNAYGNIYNGNIGVSVNIIGVEYGLAIRVGVDGLTTEELINAWLEENNLDVIYSVSPVLVTTLTPAQITALIGNNTVWSDANGDCEVTFLKKG